VSALWYLLLSKIYTISKTFVDNLIKCLISVLSMLFDERNGQKSETWSERRQRRWRTVEAASGSSGSSGVAERDSTWS
jgi:hypothetical protein